MLDREQDGRAKLNPALREHVGRHSPVVQEGASSTRRVMAETVHGEPWHSRGAVTSVDR
jgi:hypothetical protein